MLHEVKLEDLQECKRQVDAKIEAIMESLAAMNKNVEATHYVGQNADMFADGMNAQVDAFCATQELNLIELLRVVTNNMNVVVTKLGGEPFQDALPVNFQNAEKAVSKKGDYFGIETDDMVSLKGEITTQIGEITGLYEQIAPQAIRASEWVGPEKDQTADMVEGEVKGSIVPAIVLTETELQTALDAQISLMEQ